MMPTSDWPRRLSLTPLPVMNAASYPARATSRVEKPSKTPGSTRISGASINSFNRLAALFAMASPSPDQCCMHASIIAPVSFPTRFALAHSVTSVNSYTAVLHARVEEPGGGGFWLGIGIMRVNINEFLRSSAIVPTVLLAVIVTPTQATVSRFERLESGRFVRTHSPPTLVESTKLIGEFTSGLLPQAVPSESVERKREATERTAQHGQPSTGILDEGRELYREGDYELALDVLSE